MSTKKTKVNKVRRVSPNKPVPAKRGGEKTPPVPVGMAKNKKNMNLGPARAMEDMMRMMGRGG